MTPEELKYWEERFWRMRTGMQLRQYLMHILRTGNFSISVERVNKLSQLIARSITWFERGEISHIVFRNQLDRFYNMIRKIQIGESLPRN